MSFQQLSTVNQQGGDPRLYEALRLVLVGSVGQSEDLRKTFDANLLQHLTTGCQAASGSDSDGEGSSGPSAGKSDDLNIHEWEDSRLYFKGYPECDYLRQVSFQF